MGDPYGLGRVQEPAGAMPQPAWRIDNTMQCRDDEVLIDVDTLNIDAASFVQIKDEVGATEQAVARRMKGIVRDRGKHHNPVTGSGGMLIGKVRAVGAESPFADDLKKGDRIATLVSLSLTPLTIDDIEHVDLSNGQVKIKGQAILFASGIYVKMPNDLPDRVTLAVCDVCGAPAQTARLITPGQTVAVLGAGGKSGTMVLAQARRNLGKTGRLIALEYAEKSANGVRELHYADDVIVCDATKPAATLAAWEAVTGGILADVTINCVSVSGTELASILITRDRGLVYFFSMATSFTTAALGAEGVGKDVDMMIGNGYARGHAGLALDLIRSEPALMELFAHKVGV
ncbi:MAG: L-erythro-3,5-diaminohexanoate dehydrogenase [Firmicutes bacterium]|nr:L-erythro-3,5-diaminohexanoate dehydrogenase [Bacillota bacterium]